MAKIIALKPTETAQNEAITLAALKTIWNDETTTYTESELLQIRDWMNIITGIIVHTAIRHSTVTTTKIIALNHTSHETAKSHPLCAGEYRRAS